ncbi:MAG TPA: hypothetical protein VN696_09620 [Pyrinomonadaceae bacterium]|nr:hypothetical protein [Pyrinomonadaceae bacterium]
MNDPKSSTELERIISTAEVELRQIHPGLFSPEGFQRLTERINEFIGELTVESVKVAKRHQSDSVSPAYVDQASEHLTSGKLARWQRLIGSVGGIVFGVGLAAAGSMIQSGQYSTRGFVLSLVCIVAGMPAFMFHIMKE